MLRELEKRFVNNNVLLMNTSIWKERKSRKPASAYVQKIKFLVWKLRLDRTSTSRNTENFKKIVHILLIQGLSIPDILYYQFNTFLFQTPFGIFTYPTPTLQQINIAWPMMWSTLHVSLYRKALCITTIGDGRRGRERRGILKCSVVFRALNNKPSKFFRFIKQPVVLSQTQIWKIEKKVSAL